MNLQQLLDNANQSNDRAINCKGRNVELDFAELPSTHPDATTCGGQLPNGSLQYVRNQFSDLIALDELDDLLGRNFDDLHNDLSDSLKNEQIKFSSISQSAAAERLVRYMDLDAIHTYWLGGNKADSAETKKQSFQAFQARMQRLKNKQGIWQADYAELEDILFSKPNAAVWAIPHEGTPPHQQDPYNASAQIANMLCKALALPIRPDEFDEKVGLVAILYTLPQNQLFKPSIVHAEGYAVFFPGLKTEQHGRTVPLNDQFTLPWCRNDSAEGLPEYVHIMHPEQKFFDLHIESIEYVGDFVFNLNSPPLAAGTKLMGFPKGRSEALPFDPK